MKVKQHQTYKDCKKFMSSHGLRILRRQLRKVDSMLQRYADEKTWEPLSAEKRMWIINETFLEMQKKQRQGMADCFKNIVIDVPGKTITWNLHPAVAIDNASFPA